MGLKKQGSRGTVLTEWLEYASDWGYWVNPDTFFTPRIKKSIRVGAVYYEKNREILDDGRQIIATTYGVAKSHGTEEMGKREVSQILAKQMVEYMREKMAFPPNTSVKKILKNGNADIAYEPSDFDKFTIRFTPSLVGGNVEDFLNSLGDFEEKDEADLTWKVEPAKSSRSTCKTCGEKIKKDELRLGEPGMFDDHVTYKWHHLSCLSRQLRWIDLDSLEGYSDLSDDQKSKLQDTKSD
jgi:hypothetical protein